MLSNQIITKMLEHYMPLNRVENSQIIMLKQALKIDKYAMSR